MQHLIHLTQNDRLSCAFSHSYTQEVPSRFRKDIVRAAKHDASNEITIDSMRRLLLNINKEDAISLEEMDVLFREMGGECRKIAADRMMKLI